MKKTLFTLLAFIFITTFANAAPRFGVIAEQSAGFGGFITDDLYNAQLSYSTAGAGGDDDTTVSTITVAANYKISLDSVTSITSGVGYAIQTTDSTSDTEVNTLSINAGIERALSSNVILTAETAIYTASSSDDSDSEDGNTSLFNNVNFGVAYLF